jgi:hypothetical protein
MFCVQCELIGGKFMFHLMVGIEVLRLHLYHLLALEVNFKLH